MIAARNQMITLKSIQIKNLRNIIDSDKVSIKKINLLVGKNSSGKSTFGRIFPLLRQSAEASKQGPILWWGKLVDFGSYEEALNRESSEKNHYNQFGTSIRTE